MANRKAKQASSQSIVRHPLFPTIVAFWFAALFGLGSLAVRTSLLESVIIASRIDLIVPQAAPPLGITARALIALAMAAIGSMLGFVLALRLARHRPEQKQERVRTFGSSQRASAAPAHDMQEQEEDQDEPVDQDDCHDDRVAEPERRRALIASNAALDASIYDDGPSFMTGMAPHILDVTEFDVDPLDKPSVEPEEPEQSAPTLELDQFATVAPEPAPGAETFAAPQAAVEPEPEPELPAAPTAEAIDFSRPPHEQPSGELPEAAPAARQAFSAPSGESTRSFDAPVEEQPDPEVPSSEFESEPQDTPAVEAFADPATSPLQFSAGGAEAADAAAPVRSFDAPAPAQPDLSQGTAEGIAETDEADPLAAFRNKAAPMPVFDEAPEPEAVLESAGFEAFDEPAAGPELEEATIHAGPAAEPEAECQPLAAQPFPPLGSAAERLIKADLADLSPVELIERLALSLQRRSEVVTLARALASQPAPVAPVAVEPEPVEPELDPELEAEMPAVAVEPEPELEAEMPAVAVEPEPGLEAEMPAMAVEPADNPRFALPAAMRPIDFTQYEHDEDLPDYVPGRSIVMPSPASEETLEAIEPQAEPAAQFDAPQDSPAMPRFGRTAEGDAPSAPNEDEVLEAGYSSLLNMSRPASQRQQFVRVNDPEADTEAPQPVVIFPGQAMRAGTRFSAPAAGPLVTPASPPPSLGEMSDQARRFDAPPAQAQPAAAYNPEETERALRSALSTLQRMSGVA